jgi:hypothetical protein
MRVFLLFQVLAQLLYIYTYGAGMIFDFNGWILHYKEGSFSDIWTCFGYPGLHQVEHLLFFSIYKLFGLNPWAWTILFAALHGLISFLAYRFLSLAYQFFEVREAALLAFTTALLFLISPIASETVVEKVTIHYFSSIGVMLLCLISWTKFHLYHEIRQLVYIGLLFPVALFGLEISYIYPLMHLVLGIFFLNKKGVRPDFKAIVSLIFPLFILAAFLLLHKLIIGSFIGHYGSEVHLKTDFKEIFSNLLKYALSYLMLFKYWNYPAKAMVVEWLYANAYLLTAAVLTIGSALVYCFKSVPATKLILLWITLSALALAPVANLYFVFLAPFENDRYGYWASIFIYAGLILVLWQFKHARLRNTVLAVFVGIQLCFTISNVLNYRASAVLSYSLYEDFRWPDKKVVMLMDVDSYKGIRLFRTLSGNAISFAESLYLFKGIDMRGKMDYVYQMNYTSLSDRVDVLPLDSADARVFRVKFGQWGNWLWENASPGIIDRAGIYTVNRSEDNLSYELKLQNVPDDMVFIYPRGNKWVALDLSR